MGICNCRAGEGETGECETVYWTPSLAKWAISMAVRDPVSMNKVNSSWGVTEKTDVSPPPHRLTHTLMLTYTYVHTPNTRINVSYGVCEMGWGHTSLHQRH